MLLTQKGELVFKVWRRTGDSSRADGNSNTGSTGIVAQAPAADDAVLVGRACVDLAPLLAGLGEIYGWYHVLDSRGVRHGQLKVRLTIPPSVISLTPVSFSLSLVRRSWPVYLSCPTNLSLLLSLSCPTNLSLLLSPSSQRALPRRCASCLCPDRPSQPNQWQARKTHTTHQQKLR